MCRERGPAGKRKLIFEQQAFGAAKKFLRLPSFPADHDGSKIDNLDLPADMNFEFPLLALSYLLLVASPAFGSQPTWVGVEIRSFAQTREKPEVMFATDSVGLFRSADRGRSWEPLKTPKGAAYGGVVLVPEDHRHLILWGDGFARSAPLGYRESRDGGKTWEWKPLPISGQPENESSAKAPLTDLSIDPVERGGAWWIVAGQRLYRSTDAGTTWQLNAENVQKKLLILHTANLTYRLSGNTLFRSSDRGATWEKLNGFPEPSDGKEAYATDLLKLGGDQLLARVNNIWYRSQDNGETMSVEVGGLAGLPDKQETPKADRWSDRSNWHCSIRQAEGVPDSLFAFCVWDNRTWPSSVCLYRSRDGGNTWIKPSDSLTRCHRDLPSWSPVSVWMDRADPDVLFASWMAGGVYRSQDGGISWTRSDQGLRFRTPNEDMGFQALYEPPLIRAVMERDKATLDRLLAEGIDINSTGNNVEGVLEADLTALRNSRRPDSSSSLYGYLRSKGAVPPARARGSQRLMSLACRFQLDEVVEDLIESGYDWSYLANPDSGSSPSTELSECIRFLRPEDSKTMGHKLETWVERYIRAGKFPSADQMVMDLFDAERPDLALKILESASKRTAFDAQSTPASKNRIAIVPKLWNANRHRWAKRVFLASPLEEKSPAYGDFAWSLSALCEPKIVEWYISKGFLVSYNVCLADAEISLGKRTRMLALMDARGDLHKSDWLALLDNAETRWVEGTAQYRRHAREIEPLRGLIGIGYEIEGTRLVIAKVFQDYPAQLAGLLPGDQITGINGTALNAQNVNELSTTIRGMPGTTVTLDIQRAGEERHFTLTRKRGP